MQIDTSRIDAALRRIGAIFRTDKMKSVYMEAATEFLAEFQRTAPVGDPAKEKHSGNFRDAGFIAQGSKDKPDVLFMIDYSKAPYANYVEFGTERTPPHGTIRRAAALLGDRVTEVI